MGVFPSDYETWGYTPMECSAIGRGRRSPASTGGVAYVQQNVQDPNSKGRCHSRPGAALPRRWKVGPYKITGSVGQFLPEGSALLSRIELRKPHRAALGLLRLVNLITKYKRRPTRMAMQRKEGDDLPRDPAVRDRPATGQQKISRKERCRTL